MTASVLCGIVASAVSGFTYLRHRFATIYSRGIEKKVSTKKRNSISENEYVLSFGSAGLVGFVDLIGPVKLVGSANPMDPANLVDPTDLMGAGGLVDPAVLVELEACLGRNVSLRTRSSLCIAVLHGGKIVTLRDVRRDLPAHLHKFDMTVP